MFNSLFFDRERYDLSAVGPREDGNMRRARRTRHHAGAAQGRLVAVIRHAGHLREQGEMTTSTISAIAVRRSDELMEEPIPYRPAAHGARDQGAGCRRSIFDTVMPQDLINAKLPAAAVAILRLSQLSQFMDQPTRCPRHAQCASLAWGPGRPYARGARSTVRDVHPTHYGRSADRDPEGRTSA